VKQRLVTLAFAAGALLLFYLLLFPHPVPQSEKPSQPLSIDAGPDGLQALWRWMQAEGIPVHSLRYRYDRLQEASNHTPTGNVLITVFPHRPGIRSTEWQPLGKWVRAGNTVLVIAALDDTPQWALFFDAGMIGELPALSRISFSAKSEPKDQDKDKAGSDQDRNETNASRLRKRLGAVLGNPDIEATPLGEHPLLANVHVVRGASQYPASAWGSAPLGDNLPLELLRRSDTGTPTLWLGRQGEGQVIVSTLASPFTNSQIDQADNAQLLSNILAWSRGPQGVVIFDDAHQGLVSYYDPKAFFSDPRLYRTLLWLIFLWLVFVLGPLPLRSAFSPWKPVDETALVEASGRFYSAVVTPVEAAHRLIENFFNRLRRKLALAENGAPLWDWLGTQSAVSDEERASLQRQFAQAYAGERVDLTGLQKLLSDIQGKVV
jgi:hypothetical protein